MTSSSRYSVDYSACPALMDLNAVSAEPQKAMRQQQFATQNPSSRRRRRKGHHFSSPYIFWIAVSLITLPLVTAQVVPNTTEAPTDPATVAPTDLNATEGDTLENEIFADSPLDSGTLTLAPSQFPSVSLASETMVPNSTLQGNEIVNNATVPPSMTPTMSRIPTNLPSSSRLPSEAPSLSPMPSLSSVPTFAPSLTPTAMPSSGPSSIPSTSPTFNNTVTAAATFAQKFQLQSPEKFFNDSDQAAIQLVMENYTGEFAEGTVDQVNTTFTFVDQKSSLAQLTIPPQPPNGRLRKLQDSQDLTDFLDSSANYINTLTYIMSYKSDTVNVSLYPNDFENFINSDLNRLTEDLNAVGVVVVESEPASRIFTQTSQPTVSLSPSSQPTAAPTISVPPSGAPTSVPTNAPTNALTKSFTPSTAPSNVPTIIPTLAPASAPASTEIIIIAVVAVAVVVAALIALFWFFRKRKKQQDLFIASQTMSNQMQQSERNRYSPSFHRGVDGSWNAALGKVPPAVHTAERLNYSPAGRIDAEGLISPSESLVSNQSLLSAGYSLGGGDSGDEVDATPKLQDEFDHFKDQNLEKMRTDVEGNLPGFDGMISQALTKAFLDDEDEALMEESELMWGGSDTQKGSEVEASALCDVTDWLKRNDNVSLVGK